MSAVCCVRTPPSVRGPACRRLPGQLGRWPPAAMARNGARPARAPAGSDHVGRAVRGAPRAMAALKAGRSCRCWRPSGAGWVPLPLFLLPAAPPGRTERREKRANRGRTERGGCRGRHRPALVHGSPAPPAKGMSTDSSRLGRRVARTCVTISVRCDHLKSEWRKHCFRACRLPRACFVSR